MTPTLVVHEQGPGSARSWPWWRWVLTGLSVLALALSAYLSWHYLRGTSVIGCGGGNACDQVLGSRWSSIGGRLPISGLAAGAYLAIVVASFFIGPRTAAPDRRLAWGALLLLTGAAAGSAVWFTIVQKWILGAFCPYCMAAHITGLVLAALVIWRTPKQLAAPEQSGSAAAPQRLMGRFPAIGLPLAGLALAGILAGSQAALAPPAVYRSGMSQGPSQPPIQPRAVPLVGSPEAPNILTLFFDYRCPHCQQLHLMLEEAISRYDGKLAFVLCPAPLNTQCNPYVPRDVDQFKDSCELAKVSLAVWVAKREAFLDFDRWMFAPETGQLWHGRTLDAAKTKAIEMVGQAEFDVAWADPWIDAYLKSCIRMFGNTVEQGGNAVPKLVLGARWVTPEPNTTDDLITIMQDSLALPKP
jgi:uncharacterized membrane protein